MVIRIKEVSLFGVRNEKLILIKMLSLQTLLTVHYVRKENKFYQ